MGYRWNRCGTVMPLIRFKLFMQSVTFNDRRTRKARQTVDKLAPIREVSKEFVWDCKETPTLSEYAAVYEKLEALAGRCSFRQYIPSKYS
jgi:hypothetical protein